MERQNLAIIGIGEVPTGNAFSNLFKISACKGLISIFTPEGIPGHTRHHLLLLVFIFYVYRPIMY
jgi:hypothetical protein